MEEDKIFKAIQNNDKSGLNRLFDLYFIPLCQFVNTLMRNPMISEEIVSDVFFNLWVKRKTLKINGNIKSYLFKSSRNQAISYLRKPSLKYESLEGCTTEDFSLLPDQQLMVEEHAHQWKLAIDQLPEQCKVTFMLQREEGFSYQQIAEILDVSVKTVEKQMGKALRILRTQKQDSAKRISP